VITNDAVATSNINTPFTRYNRLSKRFDNRFDNRLYRVYKHLTGCQLVWQLVWQQVVSCKRGLKTSQGTLQSHIACSDTLWIATPLPLLAGYCFHHRLSVCLFFMRITQKVMGEFTILKISHRSWALIGDQGIWQIPLAYPRFHFGDMNLTNFLPVTAYNTNKNKLLSCRRKTARALKSVEILSAAAQLYEKSHLTRRIALSCGIKILPVGSLD